MLNFPGNSGIKFVIPHCGNKNALPKLSIDIAWIAIFLTALTLKDFLMTIFKKFS